MKRQTKRDFPRYSLIFACLTLLAFASVDAASQTSKPISRKGLVEAVRINGLSTPELVQIIERRGVDFEMTADAERELAAAGARPEVIAAARTNYRARVAQPATSNRAAAVRPPTPRGQPVPSGPPLSKSEVVTMLQGGIAPTRVEQFVEARGINFEMNSAVAREITAAGGTRSLIGLLTEKAAHTESDSPFADNPAAARSGPDYDDYVDRINSMLDANDAQGAIRYAQEAIRLDPSQPTAYSLLGFAQLYGRNDIVSAAQAMRAAIERGGSARFAVYHSHTGDFATFCLGSFFVTKTGVSFKANDGRDTFETADSNIKEAKLNGWVGLQYNAFHIKPVQKINGRDNFNFAPATRSKAESQLLLELIRAY